MLLSLYVKGCDLNHISQSAVYKVTRLCILTGRAPNNRKLMQEKYSMVSWYCWGQRRANMLVTHLHDGRQGRA